MSSRRCFVLVDWWGQVRQHLIKNKNSSTGRNGEIALRRIENLIELRLKQEAVQPKRWEVIFRLYAGWMNGGTAMPVLKDYEALRLGYASRRRNGHSQSNITFMPSSVGLYRGDRLLSDESGSRLERKVGVHFPFTSRSECNCQLCQHLGRKAADGFECDRIMEKQVDTSIVADAITLALKNEKVKIIIVSNDDDIFPALIASEALGGDICMINTVRKNNNHATQMQSLISNPEELGA